MPQERYLSRLHHRVPRTSRSRRREHVFICMFYPSAALNPAHPDRKVRSAARRARVVAASRHRSSRTDSPAKLCPKSTGADVSRINSHRERTPQPYELIPIESLTRRVASRPRATTHAPTIL
ncbi:unnamed protein product, partial [Brenthis ino]